MIVFAFVIANYIGVGFYYYRQPSGTEWAGNSNPRLSISSGKLVGYSFPEFVGTTNKSGLAAGAAFIYIFNWVYTIFIDGPGYFM